MKATFLKADVPLTKTFYVKDGKIEKIGHPRILNYTSIEQDYSALEEFGRLLVANADMGHCFLKGNVVRPLINEPRSGSTNPNEPTKLLLLDFDGLKGAESIDEAVTRLGMGDVDYVVQYSSSMGVLPARGLSAHVFVLLQGMCAPAILKQYLIQWNLENPLLIANLGLTRTYNALRWSLDITTCQNDKLIYIAPPLLKDGVEDSFKGERIQFVKKARRTLEFKDKFPNAEVNRAATIAKLNELRKQMGLKERPQISMKMAGPIEYMAKPDRAVVTGIRERDKFTYLNLNGGDSWGYYHPTNNPEFVHNFKNEPVYKTSELLPDYWAEVRHQMNEVRPSEDGKLYLAFRDFRTAAYHNGIHDTKTQELKIAMAKSESQLRHFMMQHGQPMGDYIPDWDMRFDPHSDVTVDVEHRKLNTFQPSLYMKMRPRVQTMVPPYCRRIMLHMLGDSEELLEHLLNTLAVVMQLRVRTGTGWILQGTTGTGKGLFLNEILRPLFGMHHVISKRIREIDSQFNGYMEEAFFLWVDEAQQEDFEKQGLMNADIKNFITEPRISIRKMHTLPYEVDNYLTWFLVGNTGHTIKIDREDRRFNVGVYQAEKLFPDGGEERANIRLIESELVDMYHYLMTRNADPDVARMALNTTSKQQMIHLNQPAIDVAAEAILAGNYEFFRDQIVQGKIEELPGEIRERAEQYRALVESFPRDRHKCLLREELYVLLDYTIGGMPKSPIKFSSYLKHHRLNIQTVKRDGKTQRGVPVKWNLGD
jgi:hypothetical protein